MCLSMGDGVGGCGDCFGLERAGFGAGRGEFGFGVWACGVWVVCLRCGVIQFGFAGCGIGFLALVSCFGESGVGLWGFRRVV